MKQKLSEKLLIGLSKLSVFVCLFVSTDKPNVAFSASLFGHGGQTVGGHLTEETLKFLKVFTNIGNAYSPITGMMPLLYHSISKNKLAMAAL